MAKSGDLGRYLALCERGELYEYLMEPGEDRDCMKVRLFRDVLYGQNRFRSPLKERFEREFPTMAAMLRFLKQGDYRQSARLMQSYESTIFIAIICRRLMEERPELPVFTIHDSVLTRPSDAEYVRSVILDEFGKLGVTPTLKEEQHGPAR